MTTRPNISVLFSIRACLISAGQVAAMSILFFGLTVLAAEVRFGSLEAGRAYFAGVRVLAKTPEIRGYYDPAQREVTLKYLIRNLDDFDVPIAGASASCTCTVTENLPVSIPARGSVEIPARIRIDSNRPRDDLRGEIRVFTGHRRHHEILLSYILKPAMANSKSTTNHVSTQS